MDAEIQSLLSIVDDFAGPWIFSIKKEPMVVPPPPRNSCYELIHCRNPRRSFHRNPEGASCGCAFRTKGIPYVLYCAAPATKQGASGYWSCSMHVKRPGLDVTRRTTTSGKSDILSGFGVNYIYSGEAPVMRISCPPKTTIPRDPHWCDQLVWRLKDSIDLIQRRSDGYYNYYLRQMRCQSEDVSSEKRTVTKEELSAHIVKLFGAVKIASAMMQRAEDNTVTVSKSKSDAANGGSVVEQRSQTSDDQKKRPLIAIDPRGASVQTVDENGHSTTDTMSREQLAQLNLPGREIFGPMTESERKRIWTVLERHLSGFEIVARTGNEDMIRALSEIKQYTQALKNNTIMTGPITALNAVEALISRFMVACGNYQKSQKATRFGDNV